MEQEDPKSTINNNINHRHNDFLEDSLFVDASDSFKSDHSLFISEDSSISDIDNISVTTSIQSNETLESPSSSSFSDLDHRQQNSEEISPSHSFNAQTNGLVDSDPHDCKISRNLKGVEKSKNKLNSTRVRARSHSCHKLLNEENNKNSAIHILNDDGRMNDEPVTADSTVSGSNLPFALAGLVIKLIGFQLNLLITSFTVPTRLIYYSYLFMIDPFRSMRLAKHYTLENISRSFDLCCSYIKWIMYMWIKKHESTWKLCLQIGWGLLWSIYVGFILISLLVFAFVISGTILKCILEEPIQITQQLSFDYTKDSPTAFVPLMSCPEPSFLECSEVIRPGCSAESRVIPLDHKLHTTVSLTLPESDYNRNLGIFQVRVDFLSGNGSRLASTRQPCMLQFKSQPIRLILTFLQLAPLISGYSSESQTLHIKLRGYTERNMPTSCLKVILEQRAEFKQGGGVPEIYEASLKLESQPPILKRILWYWKGTIYVWVSITLFVIELLFTLLCCSPVIVPWLQKPSGVGVSSNNDASCAGPK